MMDKQELRQYIDKYRKCLLESVEWWQKFSPDAKHGGFYNYLGRDGKVLFTDTEPYGEHMLEYVKQLTAQGKIIDAKDTPRFVKK